MLYGLTITTTAIEGGIITSTISEVTGGLAVLFLKEELTKNIMLGILLAVLGTLIIKFSLPVSSVKSVSKR
ncbi:EamA family transporter [Bacillus sp. A1]|uniref:EamA family transporter n=1 Tax=Bacillus sp. A1 TaxID=228104 RepID=UPI0035DC97D7